ncbi:N-acetylmuramoyl-L-alanine amidase [Knoellia sp. CPCC 206435]|uniref:N-acetylmuramoyl-L-alanine amidase n=1 Tax=Knoellia terrae TaxID=3404797 RepID=UPI003B427CEC
MPSAPRPSSRPSARRTARVAVLALMGAVGLSALPVTGTAAPAPRLVAPTITKHPVSALRSVAADTVELPTSAPVVGVTWPADVAPPAESSVFVRVRSAKGPWGPWLETAVSSTKDPSSTAAPRVGTDPVWVGGNPTATQVRLPRTTSPRTAKARGAVAHGQVELVQPGTSAADALGARALTGARAVPARPSIVSRRDWGADESLRTCGPSYGETLRGVFVHHTAGSNSYSSAESASIVRGIYAYHTKSLGWCDVGYNVLVDKYGQVFEGRAGGLDRAVTGAHALGFNTDTWGVSVLGNYETAVPTAATMSALAQVIAWRASGFYRSPATTTTLTSGDSGSRYPKGTKVTLPFISGHRDTNTTACPGANLYSQLPALRTSVAQLADHGDSPVYRAWVDKGGAQALGWVRTAERPTPFGVRTHFQGGQSLWSTTNGVFRLGPVTTAAYEAEEGERVYGAPVADERVIAGGTRTDFARSVSVIGVDALGRAHSVHGAIRTYWDARGGPASPRGMPTGPMSQPTTNGWLQSFTDGQIHYTGKTGGRSVVGGILTGLWQLGGPAGRLGYPTAEQSATNGGTSQRFQGGRLWWHSTTSAHATFGAIDAHYVSRGGPTSSLGFPTSEERTWARGVQQDFQGGTLGWDRSTGQVSLVRRIVVTRTIP